MATTLFASIYLPPGMQLCDSNGDPLNGGKVYVYEAGTTTPDTSYPTYTDALAGTNANANPVILDSAGRAQIWLQAPRLYKIVVKTSADVTIQTVDNYSPAVASAMPAASEWVREVNTVAYSSATMFNITGGGDLTGSYYSGCRVKVVQTGGTVGGTVVTSSYSSPTTSVRVRLDGGISLNAGLSEVYLSLLSPANGAGYLPAYEDPPSAVEATIATTQAITTGGYRLIHFDTVALDIGGEYNAGTYRFTPYMQSSFASWSQRYLFVVQIKLQTSITSAIVAIYKNGALLVETQVNAGIANGAINVSHIVTATGGSDYFEVYVNPSANVTVVGGVSGSRIQIARLQ